MQLPMGGAGLALVVVVIVFALTVAFLPTLIATVRGVDTEHVLIFGLLNVLACPTIVGWFVLLAYAIKWPTRKAARPLHRADHPSSSCRTSRH
ncbi:superinfection immunity protein [Actinomadura gamaensis]|uniref:Superinfection immunity protein n=1 Tax=Actinomadura gamaensis TaxID=1763541 RepID=A0ABV9TTZ2_9ACTN